MQDEEAAKAELRQNGEPDDIDLRETIVQDLLEQSIERGDVQTCVCISIVSVKHRLHAFNANC